jgi:hypothetical protein
MSAQAIPLDPGCVPEKSTRSIARDVLETAKETSSVISIVEAPRHIADAVGMVENGIATGATELATVANNQGWNGLATACLKIAAAAPAIAKIVVCIAVVAVAFFIFRWFRSA